VVRLGALAALAASLLALTACGGDEGAPSAGADLVPASASFVAVLDTDFESGQWQTVDALIERFPGGRGGVRGLFGMQDDVDFEQDVEPALGPESVVAALDTEGQTFVLLTQPDDPEKLRELAAGGASDGDTSVTRELSDGWWVAAESDEILDRFEQARDEDEPLGESDAWADATGELPEDALATLYVAGASAQSLEAADLPPEAGAVVECLLGGSQSAASGFAVVAEDDGLRFEGSARLPEGLPEPEEAESELATVLPGGALGVFSVRGLGEYLREAVRCATEESGELQTQVAQLELALGLSLDEDILPLLAQEAALAVYPQQGDAPAVVFATQVDDEAQALDTVKQIVERARLLEPGLSQEETDIGGVAVRRVLVQGEPVLSYAAVDGVLGFSNTDDGLQALRGQEPPLAEDEEYRTARDAAGAPAEDAGFLYVDAQRVVDAFAESLSSAGLPLDLSANLEPLRSLLLWAALEDGRATVEGFLRID
jgi:Protein of unknown function (DUF3352)